MVFILSVDHDTRQSASIILHIASASITQETPMIDVVYYMGHNKMQSASADKGFFQQQPILRNQFLDDPSYRRLLQCLSPAKMTAASDSGF